VSGEMLANSDDVQLFVDFKRPFFILVGFLFKEANYLNINNL